MGIGKDLNELLEQKNIRVADLSRLANIPASTIYSILRRDNLKIEIDVLFKLCDVLNVAPEYFYNKQRADNKLRLNPEEMNIIKKFRQLNADGKKYVLKSIELALSDSEQSFEEGESSCI